MSPPATTSTGGPPPATDGREAMRTLDSTASTRVVVGVDGSSESAEVLKWAARVAHASSAPIEVITTWQAWVGVLTAPPSGPYPGASSDAHAMLVRAVDAAYGADRPPNLTLLVREGSAAHILIEESRTAQLLVVGSRGLGEIAGLLLGSVSAHCAAHAQCSVLIVHEPDQP